jgi:AbrB family looped-hinge helix DNA binding protein
MRNDGTRNLWGAAMLSTTLTSKFQITIPKSVRDKLRVKPGQRFHILALGRTIRLVPQVALMSLKGIAKGIDTSGIREKGLDEEQRRNRNQTPPKARRR